MISESGQSSNIAEELGRTGASPAPLNQKLWDAMLQSVFIKPARHVCLQVASVVSNSVRPHRRQPTRLPRPWDSPGKNTGVYVLCSVASVMSDSLQPHGLQPNRLLCPWNSSGKNIGVGCHSLLQGIFPTQGSNSHLLHLLHWQAPRGKTVTSSRHFKYHFVQLRHRKNG